MGIDQPHVKATLFKHFEKANPVDASRLQHDGLNLTLPQPLGSGVEVGGKRPKLLHRLRSAITGHGHPVGLRPDLNPSRIEVELLERRRTHPPGATLLLLATA